jgi:transposase-like protein
MNTDAPSYHGYRHRFCLSFRDVEDLLAERGITVTYQGRRHYLWRAVDQEGDVIGVRLNVSSVCC